MIADQKTLPSIEIVPANSGGFVVMVGPSIAVDTSRGRMSSFDFAGTLDDCLAYAKDRLTLPQPSVSDSRVL